MKKYQVRKKNILNFGPMHCMGMNVNFFFRTLAWGKRC